MSYARKSTNPVIRASDSWSILNDRYQKNRTGADDPFPPSSSPSDFLARFSTKHEKITFVQLSELCCVPLHRHRPQDRLSAATVIGRLAERRSPGAVRGRSGRSAGSVQPHPSVRGKRLEGASSGHPAGDPGVWLRYGRLLQP